MNYAAQSQRPNPAAMIGALGVPAAFGALLVAGLAVKVVIEEKVENPDTVFIDPKPIDPPKPPDPVPTTEPSAAPQTQTPQTVPTPESPFDLRPGPIIETAPINTPIDDFIIPTGPIDLGGAGIDPVPALPDPIQASPRNQPARWITDGDYKARWIREGREGLARFELEISASGRVSNCTITGSTGHAVLDAATCRHITSRARFNPAKDSSGNPVAGTYSNAVNWKIPE